ncbi:FtsW/RodA/SpoVE family cell cycle protein [Anaerocolumna sp.]|uniref:FtsW/RodA/SpoVE family cell cycle protein n=1 Tax=Anaerocolumna sp. TaxID=2041569 RepID=UPI0028AFAB20|nr:FtsW/RodA/SpoVE family cell cycle protein [Anaerocolumna sp.]
MPLTDEIKKYSTTVCEQVRWKKAHPGIAKEIEDHLCDQRDYYLSQGEEEEAATKKAILQMGDAVSVGIALDKTHKPKPQWILILLSIALILVGGGARYLIDSSESSFNSFSIVPYIFSIIIFFAAYFLDFTALAKYPKVCYFTVLLFSIAGFTLASGINGRAWFIFAGFAVNLSYLALIFPLAYSLLIYAMGNKGTKGVLLCVIGYMPYGIILLLVPSTTGFVLYTVSALVLLFVTVRRGWLGGNKKQCLRMALIPTVLGGISVMAMFLLYPYRLQRIRILMDPSFNPKGFQTNMIRQIMSGAAFIGKGVIPQNMSNIELSKSGINTNSIFTILRPGVDIDQILTILTHNYGWIVFIGITLLFIVFSILGFYYVSKQRSVLGLLVSLSILMIFVMQTVSYIAGNLGYGLLTELSLPLVSYGRSALFLNAGLIGIMLSVFRTGDIIQDGWRPCPKNSSFISYEDGKLIINLKG